jgi:hypothetical protein
MAYNVLLKKNGSKGFGFAIALFALSVLFFLDGELRAAVAPNDQTGECGPYYIWYQTSPDSYPPLLDYLDLCGITFDISGVVSDFDFVYFTDNEKFQRAGLDKDRDGVSDLFFEGRSQNQLKWRPPNGCVRVNLRECQDGIGFRRECGYAMISIQPKRGFRDGSARIAIGVDAKCPPNGADCSHSYEFVHRYSGCISTAPPEFVVQARVLQEFADSNIEKEEMFQFTVTVRNTGTKKENNNVLTNITSAGSNGGRLHLSFFSFACPREATCNLIEAGTDRFEMSLADIPPDGVATISYNMKIHNSTIPEDVVSYFSNTATLSTGESASLTVGVAGVGGNESSSPEWDGKRQENPYRH